MPNENLKDALRTAGITPEEFADIINVDPKTVQRWVAGTTVPYRRHRASISRALNLNEADLWPNRTANGNGIEPADTDDPHTPSGLAGEVTGVWAYADDENAPSLPAFIADTTGPIDVLDRCCGIPVGEQVTDLLMAHAETGRAVRILTDGQAPRWQPLLTHPLIDVYLVDIPGEYWLIKTPDRMLLTINLEADPGSTPPPLLELHAGGSDGLFTRLESKFAELWQQTSQNEPDPQPVPASLPADGDGAETTTRLSPARGRRWPGRPDRPQ